MIYYFLYRKLLDKLGITAFLIEDIDELGIVDTMKKALDVISPKYVI